MTKLKQYIIYFTGLKEGSHDFRFEIDKSLFLEFGEDEITDAQVVIDAVLIKKSNHLAFTFEIEGNVSTTCDRCLGSLNLEISDSQNLYVNFGEVTSDVTDVDDTMILARSEDKIDLAKHFYDYLVLNLPLKKIHPDDENGNSTCDEEMLKKLDEYQSQETNDEETDPRWDKLKNLLN
jgi:uncharacterized metal-binding protein YceD (DUF177 family)